MKHYEKEIRRTIALLEAVANYQNAMLADEQNIWAARIFTRFILKSKERYRRDSYFNLSSVAERALK